MKKILCPTDFSSTAEQGIAYAAKLAKKTRSEITLLNVQTALSLPPTEVIKGKFLATEPMRERLEEKSYQVTNDFQVDCLSDVEPSNASLSEIITQRAKDFDLIVMGTEGADSLTDFFFGTNAYQVAKESKTPVLLVPAGCEYKPLLNIVYAFDYEGRKKIPLEKATEWAHLLGAKINVLQVKERYSREIELNSKEIEEKNKLHENTVERYNTVYANNLVESIENFVAEHKADALALCFISHPLLEVPFHKRLIKAITNKPKYPLFLFHEE